MEECGVGSYSSSGDMFCHLCDVGYRCSNTGVEEACVDGEYSPLGERECGECEEGHYCPTTKNEMIPCPTGTYQHLRSQTQCIICPQGKQCDNNVGEQDCHPGEYSNSGENLCVLCPEGFRCEGGEGVKPASGPAGMHCYQGECYYCDPGSYCPSPNLILNCPSGTFSNQEINQEEGDDAPNPYEDPNNYKSVYCTYCPPGSFCPVPGTPPLSCRDNHGIHAYSGPGATECSECAAGEVCPSDYNHVKKCPPHSYKGGESNTTCYPVQPGDYSTGTTTLPLHCESGLEFSTGLIDTCHSIPTEYYLPEDLSSLGPLHCPFATIGVEYGCQDVGANKETWDAITTQHCPQGYYSSNNENWCRVCPPGFKCNSDGTITKCGIGEYSPEGDSDCHSCQGALGAVCPLSSAWPIPCPMGTIPNYETNTCELCQAGYSLGFTNECSSCPIGYYCPYAWSYPIQCPLGHYNSKLNVRSCDACEDGFICYPGSTSSKQHECPKGYYCDHTLLIEDTYEDEEEDSTYKFYLEVVHPCPPGVVSTKIALAMENDCLEDICPDGYYCPPATSDYTLFPCPVGHVCPKGSKYSVESPCAAGTYREKEGGISLEDCAACPPFNYCPEGSSFAIKCPAGYDCSGYNTPALTPSLFSCKQAGAYPRVEGGGCIDCPKGAYCTQDQFFPTLCPVYYILYYIYIYIIIIYRQEHITSTHRRQQLRIAWNAGEVRYVQ